MYKIEERKTLFRCWMKEIPFDKQVVKAVKGFCGMQANKFLSNSLTQMFEDLFNICLTAVWEGIQNYKLICSTCSTSFANLQDFTEHAVRHRKIRSPKISLLSFVHSKVIYALQHSNRKDHAIKRVPKKGLVHVDQHEGLLVKDYNSGHAFEMVDFMDLIENILNSFDELEREIVNSVIRTHRMYVTAERIEWNTISSRGKYTKVWRTIEKLRRQLKISDVS